MPEDDQRYVETPPHTPGRVTVMISADALAARLEQLSTRTEMWRAVLLGVTIGAYLVQCLARLFRQCRWYRISPRSWLEGIRAV